MSIGKIIPQRMACDNAIRFFIIINHIQDQQDVYLTLFQIMSFAPNTY
jgi:hypothetical protein